MTDLSILLEDGLKIIKRRSLVFILSDFISIEGWEGCLRTLNHKHETLAVLINDPLETTLPDAGAMILEDAETGEQIYVDTHDKRFRKRFEEDSKIRKASLDMAFKHGGVDVLRLSTDEDLVKTIVRFASLRRQRH